MLQADLMQSLPAFFLGIPDPRRAQGRRHRLTTVLAIAAGAVLCGMHGYRALSDWAKGLGSKARMRFGCRYHNGRHLLPSKSIIRDVLMRVDPAQLDRALQRWNEAYAGEDESLAIDIQGKDVTADALLTQRQLAEYLVTERKTHYYFTVKGNQPGLLRDLTLYFQDRQQPHFVQIDPPDHGRIETRKIWTTPDLNNYLDFPHVGQAFLVERQSIKKKSGHCSFEIAYGVTSRPPEQASPQQVLKVNRGHWTIENSCHYIIDWNYDEDRGRIRLGNGPENITRLRRFAIGVIKSKGVTSVAQKMRELAFNVRSVFDYPRMTDNSCAPAH